MGSIKGIPCPALLEHEASASPFISAQEFSQVYLSYFLSTSREGLSTQLCATEPPAGGKPQQSWWHWLLSVLPQFPFLIPAFSFLRCISYILGNLLLLILYTSVTTLSTATLISERLCCCSHLRMVLQGDSLLSSQQRTIQHHSTKAHRNLVIAVHSSPTPRLPLTDPLNTTKSWCMQKMEFCFSGFRGSFEQINQSSSPTSHHFFGLFGEEEAQGRPHHSAELPERGL